MRGATVIVIATLSGALTVHAQRVIHVDARATGAHTGASWADAYPDVQDALDEARASNCSPDAPCEIWVAEGVYRPDRGTGSRTLAYELISGLAIYGGFAGNESHLDQRRLGTHETILSGDLNTNDAEEVAPLSDCCSERPDAGCDDQACMAAVAAAYPSCIDRRWSGTCAWYAARYCCDLCRPSRCDNSHNVARAMSVDESAILDGLTITGGEANGPESMPENLYIDGGGLFINEGNPKVRNCTFTANAGLAGPAVYVRFGEPFVAGSVFAENYSYSEGWPALTSLFSGCELESCMFSRNRGGGAFIGEGSRTIQNCVFVENRSTAFGGGLTLGFRAAPNVIDCLFLRNEAPSGAGLNASGFPAVINCAFLGNHARGVGGGINSVGSLFVLNSLFQGNSAGDGISSGAAGAISGGLGATILVNSTIANNSAGGHGGVAVADNLSVRNCLFWGNRYTGPTSDPYHETAQIYVQNTFNANVHVDYSIVQGWTGYWRGVGNSGVDPLFVDPDGVNDIIGTEDDDLRLSPESPAINAGDPTFDLLPAFDLDGHSRILCGLVDLGAYEFGIGDFDCNRSVSLSDFAWLPYCLTGPSLGVQTDRSLTVAALKGGPQSGPYETGCEAFDFNADSAIDLLDLAGFQRILSGP